MLKSTGQNQINFDDFIFEKITITSLESSTENQLSKSLKGLIFVKESTTVDETEYSSILFESLNDYYLNTGNLINSNSGVFKIKFNDFKQQHFDNYYKGYNDNLSKYLPKVPDVFWLCPIY